MVSVWDFDTTTLADEGVWCTLRHPVTGEPLLAEGQPVRIRLLGCDGERFRALRRRLAARRREALLRQDGKIDPELDAELEHELAAAATLDWENLRLPDGTALDCTPDHVKRLYRERVWVLEQVLAFIAGRANFLTASRRP